MAKPKIGITRNGILQLLVRYPLPHTAVRPFLRAVRHGPCRRSPVLLLADGNRCTEAQRYVDNIQRFFDTLVWMDTRSHPLLAEQMLTAPSRFSMRFASSVGFTPRCSR